MDLHIAVQGRHDLAGQIYRQLRARIVEGRLAGGTQLPSTRDLALQLGVSRKTTLDVFDRLLAEGFLYTRAGAGTFVAQGLQRLPAEPSAHVRAVKARPVAKAALHAQPLWEPHGGYLSIGAMMPPQPSRDVQYDFVGGVTDMKHFPFDVWRRCVNHALRAQARSDGTYRDAAGDQQLRLAIARYLAFNRAVASNWEDVIVTQGAQQALDLLARVTLRAGDVAAIEDPGYPPARAAFTAAGARVVAVPVDAQGLMVERLPKDARLVYVTPSHQFPLGMPMSLERRVALLEWAQARGALVIEDDYDCEYRFEGRPTEPLKSLDRAELVAYVGTFSKTVFPELRVGYMVPPASLAEALCNARRVTDWHGSTLIQAALAKFMLDGEFAKHLKRMHKLYAARRTCLLEHLQGSLAPWFEPIVPTAGIHLAALLKAPLEEEAVVALAQRASIALYGLKQFQMGRVAQGRDGQGGAPRHGLIFGYGGIEAERIDAALAKLAKLLEAAAHGASLTHPHGKR